MATTKFQNTVFDCTMDGAGNGVPTNSQDARDFLDAIAALNAAIALEKFDLQRDAVDLELYSYEFKAIDGRRWKQMVRVPSSGAVESMSFDTVGDMWTKPEFVPHRDVRDRTVALIRVYGCYEIKCRW